MTMVWPSTSRAEDAAVLALADIADVVPGSDYRVIGGNMTTFHAARYEPRIVPRVTADADAGIRANVAAAQDVTDGLLSQGYHRESGNRFVRRDDTYDLSLVIDVLVPDIFPRTHNIHLGPLVADTAPGLALALARDPHMVVADVVMTNGQHVGLHLPLPDTAVAVVMKALAWSARVDDKDALDVFRLLEAWEQDLTIGLARSLRSGSTVRRALAVLEERFVPPAGKALLLPNDTRVDARRSVAQFIAWVASTQA